MKKKKSYRYFYRKDAKEVRSKCTRGKPCQSVLP